MSDELQESFWESDRAKLLRMFPWLHLTRAFRLSTRWQNLALALGAVLLLAAGRWGLSQLPFSSFSRRVESTPFHSLTNRDEIRAADLRRTYWPWESDFLAPPVPIADRGWPSGERWPSAWTLLTPWGDFARPGAVLFQRRNSWSDVADAWLNLLLVLGVGAFFGGAITRRTALEFGVAQESSLRASLAYGVREFPYSFGAPLIAFVGVAVLLLLGRIIGWTGAIPAVGTTLAALAWGPLLVVSLLMALLLIGVSVAWPLMVAAHSCEGTDGFDALNRAYNYVFVRPWYALWLLLAAALYGLAVLTFVLWLTGASVHLSEWLAAGPMSDAALGEITRNAPTMVATGSVRPAGVSSTASWIGGAWQHGLASLVSAFVYSYFWVAATLIYLLLRKSCDACDLNQIFIPKPPLRHGDPPLVGMPAVERREGAVAGSSPEQVAE